MLGGFCFGISVILSCPSFLPGSACPLAYFFIPRLAPRCHPSYSSSSFLAHSPPISLSFRHFSCSAAPFREFFGLLLRRISDFLIPRHHCFLPHRVCCSSICRSSAFLVPRSHSGSVSASLLMDVVSFSFLDTITCSLIAFLAHPFFIPARFLFRRTIPVVFRHHSSWI